MVRLLDLFIFSFKITCYKLDHRYADKLCIPAVYDTFKNTILKNARKLPNLKNETKMLIDELEKQIDEVRQKGSDEINDAAEGQTTDNNQEDHSPQKTQRLNTAKSTQNKRAFGGKKAPLNTTRSKRGKGRVVSSSSDESSSSSSMSDSD